MFTFGREHEVKTAQRRHGGPDRASQIVDIVHAIHDLQEGSCTLEHVEAVIRRALAEGRRDVWDAAGSWLLKLQGDYPACSKLWSDLASHPSSEVRFRAASFLPYFSTDLREQIYEVLQNDKSKRVRDHAAGRWDFCQHPEKYA